MKHDKPTPINVTNKFQILCKPRKEDAFDSDSSSPRDRSFHLHLEEFPALPSAPSTTPKATENLSAASTSRRSPSRRATPLNLARCFPPAPTARSASEEDTHGDSSNPRHPPGEDQSPSPHAPSPGHTPYLDRVRYTPVADLHLHVSKPEDVTVPTSAWQLEYRILSTPFPRALKDHREWPDTVARAVRGCMQATSGSSSWTGDRHLRAVADTLHLHLLLEHHPHDHLLQFIMKHATDADSFPRCGKGAPGLPYLVRKDVPFVMYTIRKQDISHRLINLPPPHGVLASQWSKWVEDAVDALLETRGAEWVSEQLPDVATFLLQHLERSAVRYNTRLPEFYVDPLVHVVFRHNKDYAKLNKDCEPGRQAAAAPPQVVYNPGLIPIMGIPPPSEATDEPQAPAPPGPPLALGTAPPAAPQAPPAPSSQASTSKAAEAEQPCPMRDRNIQALKSNPKSNPLSPLKSRVTSRQNQPNGRKTTKASAPSNPLPPAQPEQTEQAPQAPCTAAPSTSGPTACTPPSPLAKDASPPAPTADKASPPMTASLCQQSDASRDIALQLLRSPSPPPSQADPQSLHSPQEARPTILQPSQREPLPADDIPNLQSLRAAPPTTLGTPLPPSPPPGVPASPAEIGLRTSLGQHPPAQGSRHAAAAATPTADAAPPPAALDRLSSLAASAASSSSSSSGGPPAAPLAAPTAPATPRPSEPAVVSVDADPSIPPAAAAPMPTAMPAAASNPVALAAATDPTAPTSGPPPSPPPEPHVLPVSTAASTGLIPAFRPSAIPALDPSLLLPHTPTTFHVSPDDPLQSLRSTPPPPAATPAAANARPTARQLPATVSHNPLFAPYDTTITAASAAAHLSLQLPSSTTTTTIHPLSPAPPPPPPPPPPASISTTPMVDDLTNPPPPGPPPARRQAVWILPKDNVVSNRNPPNPTPTTPTPMYQPWSPDDNPTRPLAAPFHSPAPNAISRFFNKLIPPWCDRPRPRPSRPSSPAPRPYNPAADSHVEVICDNMPSPAAPAAPPSHPGTRLRFTYECVVPSGGDAPGTPPAASRDALAADFAAAASGPPTPSLTTRAASPAPHILLIAAGSDIAVAAPSPNRRWLRGRLATPAQMMLRAVPDWLPAAPERADPSPGPPRSSQPPVAHAPAPALPHSPPTAAVRRAAGRRLDADDRGGDDALLGALTPAFLCPLRKAVMEHPVVASDGHTYEEAAIRAHLAADPRSPCTGEPLPSAALVPNLALQRAIADARGALAAPLRSLLARVLDARRDDARSSDGLDSEI